MKISVPKWLDETEFSFLSGDKRDAMMAYRIRIVDDKLEPKVYDLYARLDEGCASFYHYRAENRTLYCSSEEDMVYARIILTDASMWRERTYGPTGGNSTMYQLAASTYAFAPAAPSHTHCNGYNTGNIATGWGDLNSQLASTYSSQISVPSIATCDSYTSMRINPVIQNGLKNS